MLFVQFTAETSGSPISGLMIVKGLLQNGWAVTTLFGTDGCLASAYRDAGSEIAVIPHGRWLRGGRATSQARRWLDEYCAMRRIGQLLRRYSPDVVYINTLTGAAAAVAAKRSGIPCVWHIRELFTDVGGEMCDPLFGGRRCVRWVVSRCAARVVAISEAVRLNVLGGEFGAAVDVVPNAVADEFFSNSLTMGEARDRLNLPARVRLIGVPGTLRPMKGHSFFIEAAQLTARRFPGCHFAFAGEGTDKFRNGLVEQVASYGMTDQFLFLGNVNDMTAFYRACDVICVPSEAEPFGRTVIEAMASETPVVGTAVGGIAETLRNGENGTLVRYGHAEELAHAIVHLLEDKELARKLARNAREEAFGKYCESVYRERIVSVVESTAKCGTAYP